jgi:uncharacterized membrane protein
VLSEKLDIEAVGSPSEVDRRNRSVRRAGRWVLRKPWLVAFWLAVLGGFAISVFTPPMLGGDEPVHFTRAYQIATGDVLTHRHNGAYGAYLPAGVIADIADITNRAAWSHDRTSFLRDFSRPAPGGTRQFVDLNQAASYGPGAYASYVVAIAAGRLVRLPTLAVLYLARLAGVLSYAALLALAVRRLPVHRWVLVTCGLVPASLSLTATVSADGLTMALSFLIVAEALHLAVAAVGSTAATALRRPLAETAGACGLLALAKPPYVAFASLLLIPAWRHRARLLRPILAICVMTLVIAGLWAIYQAGHSLPQDDSHRWLGQFRYAFHDLSVGAQSRFVITHPVSFLVIIGRTFVRLGLSFPQDLFGRMSLYTLPPIVVIGSALVIGGSAGVDDAGGDQNRLGFAVRFWLGAVTTGIAVALFFIAYTNWNAYRAPIVEAFNARYLLPLLPPVALAVLPNRLLLARRWQAILCGGAVGGLVALLLLAVIGLQQFHFAELPITKNLVPTGTG